MKEISEINSVGKLHENARLLLQVRKALTLLEMVIALAILGIIMAAVLPQFRVMFNSWDSKQASAEILQNGRILIDHLNSNFSRMVRVTAVSPAAQTSGYIEFKDIAGVTKRYDIASGNNYVEFGTVGSLSQLAGPVSSLQFTCYDACDLATPITDITKIRSVKVDVTFPNTAALGQSKTFTTQTFIRANYQDDDAGWGITKASSAWFEYDTHDGWTPALCQIDSSHYLCAYEGQNGDGWSVILTVNPANWNVSEQTPFEFDTVDGHDPALVQIDSTHYLCAYKGDDGDGWSVVLEINPAVWTISAKTPFKFDTQDGKTPALVQLDSTHYLCAYEGKDGDGWSVVLEINPVGWSISKKTPLEFDSVKGYEPALAQIDSTHYLCVYRGHDDDGWSVVLEINPATWDITKKSSFEYDTASGKWPALVNIDNNHYLCVYGGQGDDGWAVILTVNTGTWAIGRGTAFQFDAVYCAYPALIWINNNNYVCVYGGNDTDGVAASLGVRTDSWTIGKDDSYVFDSTKGREPDLVRIDDSHCIFVYRGPADDGWSGVLRVGAPILP